MKYVEGKLPFWTWDRKSPSFDKDKKLIYQLPHKTKNVIIVHQEIGKLSHYPRLNGFDGNGNRWVSRETGINN